MLHDAVATARATHGENSLQLEKLLLALADCEMGTGTDVALLDEAFRIAATRERPPSTNLMRRAEAAFELALEMRNYEAAERYYQSAVENSKVVTDAALREQLLLNVAIGRVCLLAQRGEADQAETFAAPIFKLANDEFARHQRITFAQAPLHVCLSFAQRQNGRHAEAARTAQTFVERCRVSKFPHKTPCEGRGLIAQALAELDGGRVAEALATVEERLTFDSEGCQVQTNLCLAYGRALLANGRTREALEPLRLAYAFYLEQADKGPFAAEAEFWFAQAWIANGEVKRGRWMVAEARKALAASPISTHQRLAAGQLP
jgi:tetratricopeptide (TPR) repeat protein